MSGTVDDDEPVEAPLEEGLGIAALVLYHKYHFKTHFKRG